MWFGMFGYMNSVGPQIIVLANLIIDVKMNLRCVINLIRISFVIIMPFLFNAIAISIFFFLFLQAIINVPDNFATRVLY
jgi:hypothetical protein